MTSTSALPVIFTLPVVSETFTSPLRVSTEILQQCCEFPRRHVAQRRQYRQLDRRWSRLLVRFHAHWRFLWHFYFQIQADSRIRQFETQGESRTVAVLGYHYVHWLGDSPCFRLTPRVNILLLLRVIAGHPKSATPRRRDQYVH